MPRKKPARKTSVKKRKASEAVKTPEQKILGKIQHAMFGTGSEGSGQFGFHLYFAWINGGIGQQSTVLDPTTVKPGDGCEWNEEDRDRELAAVCRLVSDTLHKANAVSVNGLIGKPVELTIVGNKITGWRILEEVI